MSGQNSYSHRKLQKSEKSMLQSAYIHGEGVSERGRLSCTACHNPDMSNNLILMGYQQSDISERKKKMCQSVDFIPVFGILTYQAALMTKHVIIMI